jgi:hypothetical protein
MTARGVRPVAGHREARAVDKSLSCTLGVRGENACASKSIHVYFGCFFAGSCAAPPSAAAAAASPRPPPAPPGAAQPPRAPRPRPRPRPRPARAAGAGDSSARECSEMPPSLLAENMTDFCSSSSASTSMASPSARSAASSSSAASMSMPPSPRGRSGCRVPACATLVSESILSVRKRAGQGETRGLQESRKAACCGSRLHVAVRWVGGGARRTAAAARALISADRGASEVRRGRNKYRFRYYVGERIDTHRAHTQVLCAPPRHTHTVQGYPSLSPPRQSLYLNCRVAPPVGLRAEGHARAAERAGGALALERAVARAIFFPPGLSRRVTTTVRGHPINAGREPGSDSLGHGC